MARALALAIVVLALGCRTEVGGVGWDIRFEDDGQVDETVIVVATIREGGCSGPEIYGTNVSRGAPMMQLPPVLDDGTYGFAARARDADCQAIAAGCADVTLPARAPVVVSLAAFPVPSADCDARFCHTGTCGLPGDAAVASDAGSCTDVETRCADGLDDDCDGDDDCDDDDCAGDPACDACADVVCGPCERCQNGACAAVPDGEACPGGLCIGGQCCTGCFDGEGCRPGTSHSVCGNEGADCVACPAALACIDGRSCGCRPLGVACDEDRECCSATCRMGTCA